MKIIVMKRILLVLTLTTSIFACKKEDVKPNTTTTTIIEGCMDIDALNYNPEATENDGSCEYPPVGISALQLSSITINAMPLTNNGSNWDWDITGLTSDPDVFYVLKQGEVEIYSSTSQDNISTLPISFTENLPYTINNLSLEYTIELYDNDQIIGVEENELIGQCSLIPNEYINVGGTKINIINSEVNMTLDVEWLQ
tara:strand:+ start:173 stop:766 length:594 start_codon:yes stop_codon:yes gene_type:complete